jgi:hypothetical protein
MAQLRADQREGIAQLRDDLRGDLASLAARLDHVVTEDVYLADQRAVTQRLDTLERDLTVVSRGREEDQARQIATRRWVISAFVAPPAIYVFQLWAMSRGGT